MNFFKSVFTDEPDPPTSPPRSPNPTETLEPTTPDDEGSDPDQPDSNPTTPSTGWGFGGLLKTLQVKPDWIETYRRDLEEFGSGLKRETEILREAASKAVKDLPTSIEISATSLDSIGSNVWKSTADILSHGKESLLADSDSSDVSESNNLGSNLNAQSVSNSGKYSRFDAQLSAIQCDVKTYIEDPDDASDFDEWKSGFDLEGKSEEIEGLMRENGSIDGVYKRVVPNTVDHSVFWCRYYYRVYRLKQAENMRAKLVKRAISTEDEEELSWDVDDEEEEVVKKVDGLAPNESNIDQNKDNGGEKEDLGDKDSKKNVENEEKLEGKEESEAADSANKEVSKKEVQSEGTSEANDGEVSKKSEEKVASEGKTEASESGKESDVSVVSTQPSVEEDDMGWDEIEDIGSEDEKKVTQSCSPNRAELKKRLSVSVAEDEDLSWDIEDDDEPVKH